MAKKKYRAANCTTLYLLHINGRKCINLIKMIIIDYYLLSKGKFYHLQPTSRFDSSVDGDNTVYWHADNT